MQDFGITRFGTVLRSVSEFQRHRVLWATEMERGVLPCDCKRLFARVFFRLPSISGETAGATIHLHSFLAHTVTHSGRLFFIQQAVLRQAAQ